MARRQRKQQNHQVEYTYVVMVVAALGMAFAIGTGGTGFFTLSDSDLAVTDVVVSPSEIVQGYSSTVAVTVTNNGAQQAYTKLSVVDSRNDVVVGSIFVDLLPGEVQTFEFTYRGVQGVGAHGVQAMIDSDNSLAEADESNNMRAATLLVNSDTFSLE